MDGAAVAKVLAKAKADIEAAEGKTFDLIFCGKESTDYAASQTGLLLAAELNVPAVTNVVAVETADGTARSDRRPRPDTMKWKLLCHVL